MIWLRAIAVEESGVSARIKDRGLLVSAIGRRLAGCKGKDLYETPFKWSAAPAESWLLNSGFVDGTQRSAMFAMAA
jgi:prophage maintenance system killer protein